MIAISIDPPEVSREHLGSMGLGFPLAGDPELTVIDAYGLRHEQADPRNGGPLARPALFIVDGEGRIVWRHLTDNWRVRPRPETILEQLTEAAR